MFEGRGLACVRGGRLVFSGVDFGLRPGDALLITGSNGSGKSTLLRMMAGLLEAASGHVLWKGAPTTDDPEAFQRELHYCGHLDAIKPALTVRENLAFWTALRGGNARVEAGLETFDLADLRDLPARVLSTGQRRRLGLARLAGVPAPLWLLDEPTIALDTASVATLHETIAGHRDRGGIAVIATNVAMRISEAAQLDLDASGETGDGEVSRP